MNSANASPSSLAAQATRKIALPLVKTPGGLGAVALKKETPNVESFDSPKGAQLDGELFSKHSTERLSLSTVAIDNK